MNLDHRALQLLQGIVDRIRHQLAQAVVMAETAGTVKARAAIEAQADDFDVLGQRRVKPGEVEP